MAIQTQLYIPIKGVKYDIMPEVALRGKNLFETQLYAQDNGLTVLPSKPLNIIARSVGPETPSRIFIKYARDNSDLDDKDVTDAYKKLHEDIWEKYWVRAREVLLWTSESPTLHPRIISKQSSNVVRSYIITDYRVKDRGDKDYVFAMEGIKPNPIVSVDWLKNDGTITSEMANLLGASEDTHVWTDSNTNYAEGLRALGWNFGGRGGPSLDSGWGPWCWKYSMGLDSIGGSLLGRKL